MSKNKFYITTSIAYTNAKAHIGYALELVQADVLARYHRQRGAETFFLTGTDEHGKKIKEKADSEKKDTQIFVDEISDNFKKLGKELDISSDFFIRTTDKKNHIPTVLEVWKKLEKKGDIYKDSYEAFYCTGCEAFLSEKDLDEDGKCLDHKKAPEKVLEENYFFRFSKYVKKVKELLENEEIKIMPKHRTKEILNLLENEKAADVSFSRPTQSVGWGIDVPGDDTQKIYVWADALTNYISGLGGLESENFKKFWPADVHLIGKDILRFHAMIWPAILLSLELPLPKNIYAHGFITSGGHKMSKSLGNVVDPFELIEKYGVDASRYYLLREIPSGGDGDFSEDRFKERYGELSNKLGNLVSRVSAMAVKNEALLVGFKINGDQVSKKVEGIISEYEKYIENFEFHLALEGIFKLIEASDKLVEETKLWELPKKDTEKFKEVVIELAENIASTAYLFAPFLPETSKKIFEILGLSENKKKWKNEKIKFTKPEPLFPRLDK